MTYRIKYCGMEKEKKLSTQEAHDYGSTTEIEGRRGYKRRLKRHLYIGEADECILLDVEEAQPERLLEVGCGPGRITAQFSEVPVVVGVDPSPEFIQSARDTNKHANIEYVLEDFLSFEPKEGFDVVVMQGVWHHIPLAKRKRFIKKLRSMKRPGRPLKVIIGDETIHDYKTEKERRENAGLFYSHIIGNALQVYDYDLAYDECLNVLSDTLDNDIRGFYDENLLTYIAEQAQDISARLFTFDESKRLTRTAAVQRIRGLIREVQSRSVQLLKSKSAKRVVRGDYKESVEKINRTFTSAGFVLNKVRKIGPVDELGGMSVMTFEI